MSTSASGSAIGAPKLMTRGCGNCKDRKILCDRIAPGCSQCTRTNRTCNGYGLRLSWPRAHDGRRAIVIKPSQRPMVSRQHPESGVTLVRASNWDVEMHMFLSSSISRAPWLHTPVLWNPHGLGEKEWDLLTYFQSEASRSLTTFVSDPKHLTSLLMRISQSSTTMAAAAVLNSLLGLTSLYRYGWNAHAMELKISSLRALGRASETYDEAEEGAHHVAAGMLLCSFEVHMASCSANEWTWYVNGIKEVLYLCQAKRKCSLEADRDILLHWVYYHDVMKQFSLRHWQAGRVGLSRTTEQPPPYENKPKRQQIDREVLLLRRGPTISAPWTLSMMRLMSELCSTVPERPDFNAMAPYDLKEYTNRVTILDWRIRNVPLPQLDVNPSIRLYQLAMLIYLNRVTENILNQASRMQEYIETAFSIVSELSSCKPHFPMYIIGWEAHTDERRTLMLQMIERTKKDPSSRSLFHVEALVQAGWTQDDLADGPLSYWDKVTALVSVCSTLPSFV